MKVRLVELHSSGVYTTYDNPTTRSRLFSHIIKCSGENVTIIIACTTMFYVLRCPISFYYPGIFQSMKPNSVAMLLPSISKRYANANKLKQ